MKNSIFLSITFSVIMSLAFSQDNLMYLEGEAQGTTYHITYVDDQQRNFQAEIAQILIDFDQSVSTYQPNSLISRINNNDTTVEVDAYFKACFIKAKEIWENTNGAFDPTVYPLVNAWGFGPGKKQHIEQQLIDSILTFVGFEKISLIGNKIVKTDPRVALDFNAFAQGYSVDVISAFLTSQQISSYIVEIGGEVYAKGTQPSGENWIVGIEQPIDNKIDSNPLIVGAILENKAIATSGNYRRFIVENGVKYAHHIDPKTGYPTKNNLLSASVFSSSCIASDANATGILVMGLEEAKRFLSIHQELQVYLIYSDESGAYQVYQTPGLAALLIDVE